MVFPKPGMQCRYKYKLPDHMQRKQKRTNRDHSKIYEMLTDDDWLDIRGQGLRKLDDEEAALFDKQKEENEKMKQAKKNTKKYMPASSTKKKERNELICALPNDEVPVTPKVEVEIKQEINEDAEKVADVAGGVEEVAPTIIYDIEWKANTRARKRKMREFEGGCSDNDEKSPVLENPLPVNEESSKENDGEKQKPKSPKRKKEKLKKNAAKLQPKACGGVRKPALKRQMKKKRKYTRAKDIQNHPALVDILSDGKIKIKLSALHAYCAEAHWFISNQLKNLPLQATMIHSSFFRQPPLPLLSSANVSGEIPKKKRGPYKKRVGSSSSNLKAVNTKKQQPKMLTPKQALRRIRYRIEKHFAKMPGKQYRCPKMNDSSLYFRGNEKGNKQVWICLVCHKEELDDNGDVMICCDKCEDWYHLRCIGVEDEKYPEDMRWYCKRCMAKEIHAGTFNEDHYPLYI